jgi:hypothetical protein
MNNVALIPRCSSQVEPLPGAAATTPSLRGFAGGGAAIVSARRRSIGESHRERPAFDPIKLERKNRERYRAPGHGRRGLS